MQDCPDYSEAGGVPIGPSQHINVGYAKIFATGQFMSACRRWNEKPATEKTWTHFKSHFASAHRQHKQMKGENAAHAGFHSANATMTQSEDHMAEATIGDLANLVTATASYIGMVAGLTQVNTRLVKQLEETSSELGELRALHHQERHDRRAQEISTQLQKNNAGLMATKWTGLTQASPAPLATIDTKRRQLGLTTWEVVRPTRNNVSGRQLEIIKQRLKFFKPHPFLNNTKQQ
jgi:hypothetical protein